MREDQDEKRAERCVSDVLSNDMCRRPALVNTMQRSLFLGNLGILVVKNGMSQQKSFFMF